MPNIIHNNRKINFFARGKGVPIVFLHGFCEDHSVWNEFVTAFEDNYLVSIDLPGFGGSATHEEPSVASFADAVKAVTNHLQIEKFILIGHSMGGYVSLAFAKKYPTQLLGFGLFHSHPYADEEEKKTHRARSIAFIERNGHFHYIKQLFPALFPPTFLSSNNFLVNKLIHRASSFSAEGIIGGLEAMMNRPDQTEVLSNADCPVLFIVGKKDDVVPQQGSIDQTALPSIAHIHLLEGVGHMGMFEAQKATQKIIKRFVSFCIDFHKSETTKVVNS
ncbi:MAG: alpha/beta hydrolase [Bacteroidota bacterium]